MNTDEFNDNWTKWRRIIKKETIERGARKGKVGSAIYDLPKYINCKKNKDDTVTFTIDGLRIIKDDGTIIKYYKSFSGKKNTPEENLKRAIEHLEEVKKTHKCLIDEHILSTN